MGYRTTSCTAACVVAGSIPWIFSAAMYAETYQQKIAGRREAPGDGAQPPQIAQRRRDACRECIRRQKIADCQAGLSEANQGRWTVEAIRPVLDKWVDRSHGSLSYRMVQVLTGHGCFGKYLHRIGREVTPRCHHCDAGEDTASHTLEICPAWSENRRVLQRVVGQDVSLPALVHAMLETNGGRQRSPSANRSC